MRDRFRRNVTSMDVSIAIVNWNRAEVLEECLRSVFAAATTLQFEVIVVDNASEDASVSMVSEHYPQVTLIRNVTNEGFGAAHNRALAIARGRYLLLLNNDALLHPDTISTLVDFMDQSPQVGVCGCPDYRQTALGTSCSGAFRRFPSLGRTILENVWAVLRPPRSWDLRRLTARMHQWMGDDLASVDDAIEVAWIVGALLCVRRDAIRQVGGFDEGFFLFDEDIDLCRRIWASGWKVSFITRTSFTHHGGVSSAMRDDIESIRGASGELYFRKYHGATRAALFRIQHYALRMHLLRWRRQLERVWNSQIDDTEALGDANR